MAQPFIISSLNAGELSPDLYGNVAFKKYSAGLALCRNFFINPRGGIMNRAGTRYVGAVDSGTRLIPFTFSTQQTYVLVFGNNTIRFVTNGGFVLDGGGNVYSIVSPYATADLPLVKFTQSNDVVTLVHPNYPPQQLIRFGNANWTISPTVFGPTVSAPTNASATANMADTTVYQYVVTALIAGTQSRQSNIASVSSKTLSTTTGACITIGWSAVSGASQYYVYRTAEIAGSQPVGGSFFGFVGACTGTSFIDNNIAPNFSITPPLPTNPFDSTAGPIASVAVTAGGTNYGGATALVLDAAGSGAEITLAIAFSVINSATVTQKGEGYVNPIIAISKGAGTGAYIALTYSGGAITDATVVNSGSGYVGAAIYVVSRFGTGAIITPTLSGIGGIASITVTTAGSGYTTPTVSITGDGSGANATASFDGSGHITGIVVTAPGSGYTTAAATIVAGGGGGSGATLSPVIGAGEIATVSVAAGGSNYGIYQNGFQDIPAAVVTSIGDSSGAAFTVAITPQVNNPSCVAYFQQRQVFGATTLSPDQLLFSKTADYNNMDVSYVTQDDDSISVNIASTQLNAIKAIVPYTSMIVLTDGTCWKVDSGAAGGALTPSSISALPQSFNGASDVPPLVIGYDILYVQAKQAAVRDLSYNFYQAMFTGIDLSLLSSHLFFGHQITGWAWSQEPNKVVWAVRDDGALLSMTYVKDQEVYAWARHDTYGGRFKSVCVVSEGQEDAIYVVIDRMIDGQIVTYVERMQSRLLGGDPAIGIPGNLDNCWFVDAGLQTTLTYPAATLTPNIAYNPQAPDYPGSLYIGYVTVINGGSGYTSPTVVVNDPTGSGAVLTATVSGGIITGITVINAGTGYTNPSIAIADATGASAVAKAALLGLMTMTLSSAVLTSGNVGNIVRINGGMGSLYSVNGTTVRVDVTIPLNSNWPATSGNWSCTPTVSTVSGLDHLNGQTVSILADGSVQTSKIVIGGSITLDAPASLVTAGLPITAQAQSLYLDTGENPTMQTKRMHINCITLRVRDSRGMKVGHDFDNLVEIKERTNQPMGTPIPLLTQDERTVIDPLWKTPAQICIQQDYPLPAQINALILELAEGDTAR